MRSGDRGKVEVVVVVDEDDCCWFRGKVPVDPAGLLTAGEGE